MIVTHDTLINSWNFRGLDGSTVWHGNEHVRNIRYFPETIDGHEAKLDRILTFHPTAPRTSSRSTRAARR